MSTICNVCGYDQNPADAEYCDACGAELAENVATVIATPQPQPFQPETPFQPKVEESATSVFTAPIITSTPPTPARLLAKQPNAPIPEFFLDAPAVIGIFDPDMGPVDIDLETFFGGETVSRNHAEIYPENGVWKLKDLGSTNGVFIKPLGQTRFGARITAPVTLTPGDEIAIAKVRFLFQSP